MPDDDPRGDKIRIQIDRKSPLPDTSRYGLPPCFDAEGNPVFFGSACVNKSIQPCKVTLKNNNLICSIPHGLVEYVQKGPFTVLPFADNMILVPTSGGRIPPGCRPVVGGADEKGRPLHHAIACVRQERIPGRTSQHLGAAAVLSEGREHYEYKAYEILCWTEDDVYSSFELPPDSSIPEPSGDQRHEAPFKESSDVSKPGEKDPFGKDLRVAIPDLSTLSPPAATDFDDTTALYFGSVEISGSVLPGKVIGMRACQVLQNDKVVERTSGYTILPFGPDLELVPASFGAIPRGRRPVEGGRDAQGKTLYHAMIHVLGRKFPGMCGEQLGGAHGVLQDTKYTSETGYDILCWKERADASPAPRPQLSFEDDVAGQQLRKPLNAKNSLTLDVTEGFGEHIANGLSSRFWYFASALHNGSVIPCWACASSEPCSLAYNGSVVIHDGPYCVLPYPRDRMELVAASDGKIPVGWTPVQGGRDTEGHLLYHAIGVVTSGSGRARMIGMAAEHLGGAVIVCWGEVHTISTGYKLLCWKK